MKDEVLQEPDVVQEFYLQEEQYVEIRQDLDDLKVYQQWNVGLLTAIFVLLFVILVSIFVSKIK